ncbi:beta-ketoacyl synthase N-terminal-like domain-containing protein [Desulfobacterota bacterium M19]
MILTDHGLKSAGNSQPRPGKRLQGISIIGGELLSALGEAPRRIKTLGTGKADHGALDTIINGDKISYPYYRLDTKPRPIKASIIDAYLDEVLEALWRKLALKPTDLHNCGIFLGSSSIDYAQAAGLEAMDSDSIEHIKRQRVGGGCYADRLMRRLSWRGPSLTYNTACTSSANALMDAAAMLEGGIIDHALVFGLEISSAMTLQGFVVLQLLSREQVRPFDINRSGMILGEAVSVVLLSRADIRTPAWHYLGGSSNCETFTVTGPNPDGSGIAGVMRDALADTGLQPHELTAVKAHGTASESMDSAELRGMEQVFAAIPPYFSLKPYIGHTLGGCGVAELVLTMECVEAGFIPPTINFNNLEPEFSQPPIKEPKPITAGRFMLNYFGFGGNNTSFIIEKVL